MRRACIALVWLSVVVAPVAAQSESLPLQLLWTAPPGCPSASDVRRELTRIARVRTGSSLRPLAADGRIERTREGYRLVLQTEHEGREGLRTLEARDCETLVRSATLVLALAFGAAVELASPQPRPGAAEASAQQQSIASPSSTGASEPTASSTNAPAASARRPGREEAATDTVARKASKQEQHEASRADEADAWQPAVGLFVHGFGSVGLLPNASLGAAAGARVTMGAYALDVRAAFIPGARDELRSMIRADYRALGGSLAGCRLIPLASSFELAGCAGARALAISARTSGALAPGAATAPWTALTAAASVTWPRRYWLQVRTELSLAISLNRPRFVVESLGEVQRVALLVPELGISLSVGL